MNKKKLVAICTIVALLAVAVIGGTIAYFNDTQSVTNVFTTAGEDALEITLDEAPIDEFDADTNHFIADTTVPRVDGIDFSEYEDVTPGAIIDKDPTVTNTGEENAYIAVVVTVDSPMEALQQNWGGTFKGLGLVSPFIEGGIADDDSFDFIASYHGHTWAWENDDNSVIIAQDPILNAEKTEVTGYRIVYYFQNQFETDDSEVLFDTINIPATWEEDDMEDLENLTMDINAYAVQGKGFTDVYDAVSAVFPTEFPTTN